MTELEPNAEFLAAPPHWRQTRLSRTVQFRNGADYKAIEVAEPGYPVFGSGGRFRWASSWIHDGPSVLFGRKGTIDRPVYVDGKFWTVDTMFYTVPDQSLVNPRFLYYWATRLPFSMYMSHTALPSMTQSDLGSARIALPPLSEQQAIVNHLDHETTEIDAFIADLELAAHLTSVRFDGRLATTFAEVPDWVPLRRLATLSTGSTPSSSWGEDAFHPDGLDWIGPGDINESARITRGSKRLSQLAISEVRVHRTPAILVVGIGATVGRVGQTEGPFATNQQITAVTPKSVDTKYLYFALRSLSTYVRKTAHGNTLPIVNNSQLGALKVPLACSADQVRLACELDIEMSRTKEVRNEIRQAVDLARERRTALISAAVTGQIDVTQRHRPVVEELEEEVLQIK